MPQTDFRFAYRFRVRWSETDAQSVVFNARYLDYGDLGITEYWRAINFRGVEGVGAIDFHVARAEVDFKKPILSDELIDVFVRTERFGNSSMTVLMELHGAGGDDLRAVIREVQVLVDLTSHTPKPIPDLVRQIISAFDARGALLRTGEGLG